MTVIPFPADTWTGEGARGLSTALAHPAEPGGAEATAGDVDPVRDRLAAVEERLRALEPAPPTAEGPRADA